MTIQEALKWGIEKLIKSGVEAPVLDAEVLLAHSAIPQNRRIDRAWLHAHPEMLLHGSTVTQYKRLIARRARREPVAYITGRKEFYGLDFLVNRSVMVPRPESETLVELALDEIRNSKLDIRDWVVVDVGTGSGCLSVSIIKQSANIQYPISNIQFFATDISPSALRVARANARRHGVADKITFLHGNLLAPFNVIPSGARNLSRMRAHMRERFFGLRPQNDVEKVVIVANLPYLPTAEWRATQPEIRQWEPREALDGGRDGLKYYQELFAQLQRWIGNPSSPPLKLRGGKGGVMIFCELCPHQIPAFKNLATRFFPSAKKLTIVKDLAGRHRVAAVKIM